MSQTKLFNLEYLSEIYGGIKYQPNLLRVLTYHRISRPPDTPSLDPGQISAVPETFEKQMSFLQTHYNVVSMEQVFDSIEGGKRLPKRSVLITFDDACCDVGAFAWPILKKYRLPATVFVPTAFPDHPERMFWWDRLYRAIHFTNHPMLEISGMEKLPLKTTDERRLSLKKLQQYIKARPHQEAMAIVDEISLILNSPSKKQKTVLDWEELRRLVKEGLNLGAHTRNHPLLTQIPLEEAREEVRGSLEDLKRETGDLLPTFAYPNGDHNENIFGVMKEEGVKLGFTTQDGFNNLNIVNFFSLRRVNITRRTTLRVFRLRLRKWFSYIDLQRHLN